MTISGTASIVWKDVQPCETCVPLNTLFEEKADAYYQLFQYFKDRNVEVKFTNEHWNLLNETGAKRLEHSNNEGGENATSIAKRHGNMTIRIATVLTMVRYFQNQLTSDIILCSDQDFQIASWMAEESYQCSIELFKDLPGEKNPVDERLEEMHDMLPKYFKPKELASLYKSLNISKRTAERMLDKLKKTGRLISVKKGEYEKVLLADVSNGG